MDWILFELFGREDCNLLTSECSKLVDVDLGIVGAFVYGGFEGVAVFVIFRNGQVSGLKILLMSVKCVASLAFGSRLKIIRWLKFGKLGTAQVWRSIRNLAD